MQVGRRERELRLRDPHLHLQQARTRMLTDADVCGRMRTYADIGIHVLISDRHVVNSLLYMYRIYILTNADVC